MSKKISTFASTNGASHNQPRETMTQKSITIGTEVVRTKGSWDVGKIGTVIDIDGERARVNWTHYHSIRDTSIVMAYEPRRTWVKVEGLHPTSIPYKMTPYMTKPRGRAMHIPFLTLRFQII